MPKTSWPAMLLLLLTTGIRAEILPFGADSLDSITAQRTDQPFLLVLWSLDCSSCLRELGVLRDLQARYPGLDYVLVSTDELNTLPEVESTLQSFGLMQADNWIFADSFHARLRYRIDPAWSGELPRAYMYNGAHQRVAVSGALRQTQLEDWIAASRPATGSR
jgi:hypothetical protein